MRKPSNWNDITPERGGAMEKLPAGGYECIILRAKETESKNHNPMLELGLDICAGEYEGYFRKLFQKRKEYAERDGGKAPYWPCIYRQLLGEKYWGRFKGFTEVVQESNPGYKWDWKVESLEGKKIGVIFREEEFIGQNDNQIHTAVKPAFIDVVDGITEKPAPAPKTISKSQTNGAVASFGAAVNDEEIPF